LASRDPFDVLLQLAEEFSDLPRNSWGYSQEEINRTRQAMPTLSKGLVGPYLPAALARWYETIGRVPQLTAMQNRLHAPHDLHLRDDAVIIYSENQDCALWGIRIADVTLTDPPVAIYVVGEGWDTEVDRLSRFALTVGFSEVCFCGNRFFCAGMADDVAIGSLRSKLRLLPVQTLRWPTPDRQAFFLADDDVLILMEEEFFFAVGIHDDIESHLRELAAPGHLLETRS
jgi:hypothetical protein